MRFVEFALKEPPGAKIAINPRHVVCIKPKPNDPKLAYIHVYTEIWLVKCPYEEALQGLAGGPEAE